MFYSIQVNADDRTPEELARARRIFLIKTIGGATALLFVVLGVVAAVLHFRAGPLDSSTRPQTASQKSFLYGSKHTSSSLSGSKSAVTSRSGVTQTAVGEEVEVGAGFVPRAVAFIKQHKAVVGAGAGVLLLGLIGLTVYLVLYGQHQAAAVTTQSTKEDHGGEHDGPATAVPVKIIVGVVVGSVVIIGIIVCGFLFKRYRDNAAGGVGGGPTPAQQAYADLMMECLRRQSVIPAVTAANSFCHPGVSADNSEETLYLYSNGFGGFNRIIHCKPNYTRKDIHEAAFRGYLGIQSASCLVDFGNVTATREVPPITRQRFILVDVGDFDGAKDAAYYNSLMDAIRSQANHGVAVNALNDLLHVNIPLFFEVPNVPIEKLV